MVGDIIILRDKALKSSVGTSLIKSSHMFLVLDFKDGFIIASPLSSQIGKVNKKYPYNIEIKEYSKAGLVKPTHVKLDYAIRVSEKEIREKVGSLDKDQLKSLKALFIKATPSIIEKLTLNEGVFEVFYGY